MEIYLVSNSTCVLALGLLIALDNISSSPQSSLRGGGVIGMPLHLLGKKSWNVYNNESIERVRRDEAAAKARVEAEEQRMQADDAARRTAVLRGEPPPFLPDSAAGSAEAMQDAHRRRSRDADSEVGALLPRERKRRRLRGEDDTDRDIRYAREDAEAGVKAKKLLTPKEDDGPLVDHAGHLQLIPAPDEKQIRRAAKNAEAEAEKDQKRKRNEDQYTMRFSNAAGLKDGMQQPWYASNKLANSRDTEPSAVPLPNMQERDVWGNKDPLRKDRERGRITTNDPFAAMQQAQRQLKQSERDKERSNRERMADLEELKRANERRRTRKEPHRGRAGVEDNLGGFSLDAPAQETLERGSGHDRHRKGRHHGRHRSRSRSKRNPNRRGNDGHQH